MFLEEENVSIVVFKMRKYIANGKQFSWKAIIVASLLEPLDRCEICGGSGKIWGMLQYEDDDTCKECSGKGKKYWLNPLPKQEMINHLQKCLDEYIEKEIKFVEENPPFIGINI